MSWRVLTAFLTVAVGAIAAAQAPPQPPLAVLYEGARLIIGDATPPIERGAFWCRTAPSAPSAQPARRRRPAAPSASTWPARR